MSYAILHKSLYVSSKTIRSQPTVHDDSELRYSLVQVSYNNLHRTRFESCVHTKLNLCSRSLFSSPGATATPLHMAELYRENDASRFDTEKLQMISIGGLTCAQVEEYFAEAIKEGKTHEEDDEDTVPVGKKEKENEMNELSEEEMLKERESFIIKPDSTKRPDKVTRTTTPNNTVVKDGACNNNQSNCEDDPTTPVPEMNGRSNSWRSTRSVVRAMAGVGCLFILSRAFKGKR